MYKVYYPYTLIIYILAVFDCTKMKPVSFLHQYGHLQACPPMSDFINFSS